MDNQIDSFPMKFALDICKKVNFLNDNLSNEEFLDRKYILQHMQLMTLGGGNLDTELFLDLNESQTIAFKTIHNLTPLYVKRNIYEKLLERKIKLNKYKNPHNLIEEIDILIKKEMKKLN